MKSSTVLVKYLIGLVLGLIDLTGNPWLVRQAHDGLVARYPWFVVRVQDNGFIHHKQQTVDKEQQIADHGPQIPTLSTSRQVQNLTFTKLPLSFEVNQGQTDTRVKFLSRGSGYNLFLTSTEAVLVLRQGSEAQDLKSLDLNKEREITLQSFSSFQDKQAQNTTNSGQRAVLRMKLVGANPQPRVVGLNELPSKSHYFLGNDPKKWYTDVPHYAKVQYQDVYPGIDLVYYGNPQQLEYDFVVAPGANPGIIQLAFEDGVGQALPLDIDAQGDLVIYTTFGEVRQRKPYIYQEVNGTKQPISGRYMLLEPETTDNKQQTTNNGQQAKKIGFQLATYVANKPLVIDPVLVYSTYLGGNTNVVGEFGRAIAVDGFGNTYLTGTTDSIDFPTVNALQPTFAGFIDGFVAKLNSTGSSLLYTTYFGGSGRDFSYGLALDPLGNIYLTGQTSSPDFPLMNPLQGRRGGFDDVFIVKLNPAGSALVYSTYLGGSFREIGRSIAVDIFGNAYITGGTESTDFPTASPLHPTFGGGGGDAFIAKLNSTGSVLVYSTYLGGSNTEIGYDIAVDVSGRAHVIGHTQSPDFPTVNALQPTFAGGTIDTFTDAFIAKLNRTGTALVYATYLGGSDGETGHGIAVDVDGNTYVTGFTRSLDFPTANALQPIFGGGYTSRSDAFDVYVAKLNPTGSAFIYSTYLGGSDFDIGNDIAVDAAGNAYVICDTSSPNMPTANAVQPIFGGGFSDAFLAKLNPTGSAIVYATYLGGSNDVFREFGLAVAVDAAGTAYVVGGTLSTDFPIANALQPTFGGGRGDVFIAKIADIVPPAATADYNGDGKADIAVYRPSTGQWLVLGASRFPSFGSPEDIPTPGDYDGDGTADFAFWRPSTGEWHILRAGIDHVQNWGVKGDIPIPGDYNGDRKTDLAIWRPSTGEWWILFSAGNFIVIAWGQPGDMPVPADYDGDGKDDIAVFRPSNGTWYILNSNRGLQIQVFGQKGDFPVPGNYSGDGQANIAVWRPSTKTWMVLLKNGQTAQRVWQFPGDLPVQADFDGDGRTDLGLFRASTGEWYIRTSSSGFTTTIVNIWGRAGDIPVAASGGK